jgi:hypothetical protein
MLRFRRAVSLPSYFPPLTNKLLSCLLSATLVSKSRVGPGLMRKLAAKTKGKVGGTCDLKTVSYELGIPVSKRVLPGTKVYAVRTHIGQSYHRSLREDRKETADLSTTLPRIR